MSLPRAASGRWSGQQLLERLLPAGTACADTFTDEHCVLFPEEDAVIARAVEKRRREFVTGRSCARRALAELGVPPGLLVPGKQGAPVWPAGIVGAITHCTGYRAAVVARTTEMVTCGIDAEPNEAMPEGVLDAISLPQERVWVAELGRSHPSVSWDRLLFSAKESVYKAWFPLAGRWLDFTEARISVLPAAERHGTFHAELLVAGPVLPGGRPLTGFTGRWLVDRGLVVTAVTVAAAEAR
ncbi:4'-phosphopantetheinyl transferase superfamily protein [Micromonospora zamorensis]|uniref:4'-phosphopantetheinyl transferase family protein n=1 Tax=Micromonospora zamorensis TaxID=709883 RepID=UPI000C42528A|nr:4'-phosphopantetheinyl transferase superfamily protein [Micromonospora zamorensis]